jgi:ABC-type glycerol-3-phosphate transport system substrate-binding protein
MGRKRMSRRQFMVTTGATAATLAAPHVATAQAAGKLAVAYWDHWVPGANDVTTAITKEWAEKNKVEVSIDFLASQGNKVLITIAAEGQAKSGHDVICLPTWWRCQRHRRIPWQVRRQVARRPCHQRLAEQGTLLAH